jgi:hypothetical protein
MNLSDAVREILKRAGWPEDRLDIDDSVVTLPKDGKGAEKLLAPDPTGNAKDLLLHLRDTYTTAENPPYRWVTDFAPTLKDGAYKICFRFKDPDGFPDAADPGASRTWYGTLADAQAAGKDADDCARSYRRQILEPEANRITIFGETPDGTPIEATDEDRESQDPSTPYSERPDNWLGEIREATYVNPALNTQEFCVIALQALKRRLSSPRYLAEWTGAASYDDALWLVHKMTHDANRRYRLSSFAAEHVAENDALVIRNATFRGEANR